MSKKSTNGNTTVPPDPESGAGVEPGDGGSRGRGRARAMIGRMRRFAMLAAVSAVWLCAPAADGSENVRAVLGRVREYLTWYDRQLVTLVADERYVQRADSDERVLESEFGWIAVPGVHDTIGVREVRRVDGRPVAMREKSVRFPVSRAALASDRNAASRLSGCRRQAGLSGLRPERLPDRQSTGRSGAGVGAAAAESWSWLSLRHENCTWCEVLRRSRPGVGAAAVLVIFRP